MMFGVAGARFIERTKRREESRRGMLRASATTGFDVATNGDTAGKNASAATGARAATGGLARSLGINGDKPGSVLSGESCANGR